MQTIAVKVRFSVAKRLFAAAKLMDYDGVCNFLHGYGHIAEVTFSHPTLKSDDSPPAMVADFYEVKKKLQKWLNDNWDHNVILHEGDSALGSAISGITKQEVYYLDEDPTTENLAQYLKDNICPKLFKDLNCTRVRVYDFDDTYAEAT